MTVLAPDLIKSTSILRVLDGRLAGAEHKLIAGTTIRIGHGLDNDIVLRGKDTVGKLVEINIRADDIKATVLLGEVVLLGNNLRQGESVILPPYVPLRIGEYHIAIGTGNAERWDEASAIALRTTSEVINEPSDDIVPVHRPKLMDQSRSRWTSFTSYLPKWVKGPGFLLIAGFALALALVVEPLRQIVDSELNGIDDAQTAIAAAGFANVKVAAEPTGGKMLITGIVLDEAELERLRTLINRRFSGAVVDVETTQSLARAANDLLAGQSIDADAKAAGVGKIRIISEYLPIDRQKELEALLKKDLPKLLAVHFTLSGARGPDDLKYFFNSEKYGLATYVDGEPGHIVTSDGSFWFEGSTLPTGHKLLHARSGRLSFERAGQIEEVTLAEPAATDIAPNSEMADQNPGAAKNITRDAIVSKPGSLAANTEL